MTSRTFGVWDYVLFAAMLLVSGAIGIFFSCTGGKQKTTSEFLMADRQMSWVPVSLSLLASFMSAITLLGTPSEIYAYGSQYLGLGLAYCFMIPASAHLFIPVFYKLGLTSTYEYLELRFHKAVRVVGAATFIFQMTLYMSIVLYAPALALNAVTGLNIWLSVCSVGLVCTFYTTLGGMKAVMWTDTFQICMMYAGLLACLIQGSIMHGGFSNIWEINRQGGRIEFDNFNPDPTVRHSWFSLTFGGFFTWIAIYGVNQAQVQRVFAVPTLRDGQTALWVNLPGLLSLITITSLVGMVCYATYKDCDPVSNGDIFANDQILPLFVMDHLSHIPGLPGLFTACIFSGALSTLSSGLNSLAAVTLQDIVCLLFFPNLSDKRATQVSKGIACGFGLLTIGGTFVASQLGGILQAALGLFGMIGGPLLGLFCLGLFLPWSNWKGAIVGWLSGLAVTLWIGIGAQIYKPTLLKAPISTALCPVFDSVLNTTVIPTLSALVDQSTLRPPVERSTDIYSISYMWYSLIAVTVTCTVGMIVSAITGFQKPSQMDPRLFSPIFDTCCCCLPASWRRKLWCGVPMDRVEESETNLDDITKANDPEAGKANDAFSNNDETNLDDVTKDNDHVTGDTNSAFSNINEDEDNKLSSHL